MQEIDKHAVPKSEATRSDERGPGVKFPPPLVFLIGLLLGWGLQWAVPVPLAYSALLYGVGVVLVLSGLCLVLVSAWQFKRAQTHIEPWKPTSAIVSSGVFAYSRNPIYIAFSMVALGLGAVFHNVWMMLSFVPSLSIVFFVAVRKEERYLEAKFGDAYLQYKASVRRWL